VSTRIIQHQFFDVTETSEYCIYIKSERVIIWFEIIGKKTFKHA